MTAAVDRTGIRYGKLVAIEAAGSNRHNNIMWVCKCDCGKTKIIIGSTLPKLKSCGCTKRPSKRSYDHLDDLFARRFGCIVAVCQVADDDKGSLWECKCDCGNVAYFTRNHIVSGRRTSCGCRKNGQKHSMSGTPEYMAWRGAKERCLNPNNPKFPLYGARGITMSDAWVNDFRAFIEDMGRRPSNNHSLERKNSNGNYCKENCVWATSLEQNNNLRSNTFVEVSGEIMTAANASRRTGIPYKRVLKIAVRFRKENGEGIACLM